MVKLEKVQSSTQTVMRKMMVPAGFCHELTDVINRSQYENGKEKDNWNESRVPIDGTKHSRPPTTYQSDAWNQSALPIWHYIPRLSVLEMTINGYK